MTLKSEKLFSCNARIPARTDLIVRISEVVYDATLIKVQFHLPLPMDWITEKFKAVFPGFKERRSVFSKYT